jgi:hypothetical protein
MNIKPEQLTEQGYTLLDQLDHQALVPFIQLYLGKKTNYARLYYAANLLIFGVAGYFFVAGFGTPEVSTSERFTHFCYGLTLAFTLLPLHEFIHVLAYRSQGARHTYYDANLKKFYFMALADQFVANKKEFEVVALSPFVVISALLITLFVVLYSVWSFAALGALLMHTAMCSGDFGLLSYFEYHRDKQVVTYDDRASGLSFFYGKNNA